MIYINTQLSRFGLVGEKRKEKREKRKEKREKRKEKREKRKEKREKRKEKNVKYGKLICKTI